MPEINSLTSRALIELLRMLPRTAVSRLAGRLADLELPSPLQRWEILLFARLAGVDLSEVPRPLGAYASLQEFFTRPLPPGARPIDAEPTALVAPCDGFWGESGRIDGEWLLQVKGRRYTAAALLGGGASAARYADGHFATFYLAPHNYHRFHAPCDLAVDAAEQLGGTLWPVNRAGLYGVDGLFAQNERIVVHATPVAAGGKRGICMVAVGAIMVGKVRVVFDDLTTNTGSTVGARRIYRPGIEFARGAEWGRFEFGSTIILLASPDTVDFDVQPPGTPLRMGTRIGRLLE